MKHRVLAAALALASVVSIKAADSGVTLIGMGLVAGTASAEQRA